MKKWLWVVIAVLFFIGVGIFFGSLGDSDTTTEEPFNAVNRIKSQIPSDMKNRVWYSKEWTQEQISDTIWKVMASDGSAVWKVSTQNILCSESGHYVNICSDNGYAKTYSDLGYCKPDYICE